jgi:manganese/zinc/iron transport system permease protein
MLAMISSLFSYHYTLFIVILGTTLFGVLSGVLGSFALLRRQSLLGDAISHAAFPGLVATFMLTQSTDPFILMLGGGIVGFAGALFASVIEYMTSLKYDALLGIVLSVFFGVGLVLMTILQKQAIGGQAVLNKFIFGNAATLLPYDIFVLIGVVIVIFTIIGLFFKEFTLLSFDRSFARAIGYPVWWLDMLYTMIIVLAIVIGLHTAGVLLMSSMLIAPAAAARQWTARLHHMICIAGLFGGVASIVGTIMSAQVPQLPTGPVIVVVLSCIVICSLLFAPNRGIYWSMRRQKG